MDDGEFIVLAVTGRAGPDVIMLKGGIRWMTWFECLLPSISGSQTSKVMIFRCEDFGSPLDHEGEASYWV